MYLPNLLLFILISFLETINCAEIGEPCSLNTDCHLGASGNLSYCFNSVCECLETTMVDPEENPPVCRLLANHLGDPCKIHEQCRINLGPFSECNADDICACRDGAVENKQPNPVYICLLKIGQFCEGRDFHNECVGGMNCFGGICDCGSTYTASNELDQCLRIANNFGDTCSLNRQCQKGRLGLMSICKNGKCRCRDDAVLPQSNQEKCLEKATKVDDNCDYDAQCIANLEHAFCLNKICVCMEGFTASANRSRCVKS